MANNSTTYQVNSEAAWVVRVLERTASKLGTQIPVSELIARVEAEFGEQLGAGVGAEVAAQTWVALATFDDDSDTSKAINKLIYGDSGIYDDPRTQLSEFYNNKMKERLAELEKEFEIREEEINQYYAVQHSVQPGSSSSDPPTVDKTEFITNRLINDDPIFSGFKSSITLSNRGKRLSGLEPTKSWEFAESTDLEELIEDGRIIGYAKDGKYYPGTEGTWETLKDIGDYIASWLPYSPLTQAKETAIKDDKTFSDLAIIAAGVLATSAWALLNPTAKKAAAAAGIAKAWKWAGKLAGGTLISSKLADDLFNPTPVPESATNPLIIPTLQNPTQPGDDDIVISNMANQLEKASQYSNWGFSLSPGMNDRTKDPVTGELRYMDYGWAAGSDKYYIPEILTLVDNKSGPLGYTSYQLMISDGTSTYTKSGTLSENSGGIAGEAEVQMLGPFNVPGIVFERGYGIFPLYYSLTTQGAPISTSMGNTISGQIGVELIL